MWKGAMLDVHVQVYCIVTVRYAAILNIKLFALQCIIQLSGVSNRLATGPTCHTCKCRLILDCIPTGSKPNY